MHDPSTRRGGRGRDCLYEGEHPRRRAAADHIGGIGSTEQSPLRGLEAGVSELVLLVSGPGAFGHRLRSGFLEKKDTGSDPSPSHSGQVQQGRLRPSFERLGAHVYGCLGRASFEGAGQQYYV